LSEDNFVTGEIRAQGGEILGGERCLLLRSKRIAPQADAGNLISASLRHVRLN